jgi:hypothetical protein
MLIVDGDSGLLLVGSPAQGGSGLLAVSLDCCCNSSGGSDACCDLGDTFPGTITNKTGTGTAMPDSVTMTRAGPPGTLSWISNTFANPCPADAASAGMDLTCDPIDGWVLNGLAGGQAFVAVLVSADCDTLTVVFTATFNTSCGAGGFTITFQG